MRMGMEEEVTKKWKRMECARCGQSGCKALNSFYSLLIQYTDTQMLVF